MLKHIRITNFKSLGDVSVELGPVTVLIGRSGTGKTNFVESLRFLRDCLSIRPEGYMQRNHTDWEKISSATAPRPMTLSFAVKFDAPGIEQEYQYSFSFQQQNPQQGVNFHEEKLVIGTRTLFHQSQRKWVQPPSIVNPPQPSSLMLGALSGIPEVTLAHLVLTNGIGCHAFPDTVLLSPGQNVQANETGLSDSGDNYLHALFAISVNLQTWTRSKEIIAAIQTLDPSIKSIELQMPGRNRIVVSHDVGGRLLVLDINQESEGLRRFLAFLIALYQNPSKQTLVFEEPEKGIHPGALESLADQFKACPEAGRGQVIITTHSPQLLDHFSPDQLRVVQIENYVTGIRPLAPEQVEAVRDNLLKTGELLTVDPARLAPAVAS